jgi:hypothetical protein
VNQYKLLLVSLRKPQSLSESICSNHMIALGLWEEFGKLPHVKLKYQDSDNPLIETGLWDFVLIHAYLGSPIYDQLQSLKSRTRYKVMTILELPFPNEQVDHCFSFLPSNSLHCEQIHCPCLLNALNIHNTTKIPNTILLDHVWKGIEKQCINELYDWLENVPRLQVKQLRRAGVDENHTFPNWIVQIPERAYPIYLDETAHFETFILTHSGSYEHSVIDMLARGTRVLCPKIDNKLFLPQDLVDRLSIPVFSTREELYHLLDSPAPLPALGLFTDISDVVKRIDNYCQQVM